MYLRPLLLVFSVEWSFISIPTDQDVWHPLRTFAHLLTDDIQGDLRAAFNDRFIMNMANDEAVGEGVHGKTKKIAGDSLDDILHELGTVGFNTLPLLCGTNALIGDGFPAQPVFSDLWFHVGEVPARREGNEEHAVFVLETDAVYGCPDVLSDGGFYGIVNIPPKLHDVWVGGTPGIHKGLEFVFRQSHFQCAHRG